MSVKGIEKVKKVRGVWLPFWTLGDVVTLARTAERERRKVYLAKPTDERRRSWRRAALLLGDLQAASASGALVRRAGRRST